MALGWYQHIRYVFKLDYRYAPMYIVMTRSALERLPPAEAERIRTAFREREPEIIRALRVDDERALVGLRRHGIEVVVPAPEVRAAFQDRMTGLPDRLVELGLFEKSFYTDLVRRLEESPTR